MIKDFKKRIQKLASQRRPKVLIGLYQGRHSESIAESVRRAQREVADVVVVGQTVDGVESIPAGPDMADIHKKMIEVVMRGDIEGVIRGNVEEHGLLRGLKDAMKLNIPENELRIQNPCVMEDLQGNIFALGPTSTVWGRNNNEKILWTDSAIRLLNWFDYKSPKLGFLTSTRKANYKKEPTDNPDLAWSWKTWESAEYLVDYYTKKGYRAKNYEIHVEHAVADGCDIICVAEGPIGNGIFRGAFFLGGAKMVAGPRLAMSIPYEDTSQSEQDYFVHFPFVVAMINGNLIAKK
ncbi:MAG: hypothetical protein A3J62_03395 [Candidatus Buchananbacteria bacterium RIFCSPHIGHO2_02_FULL_38_8]|uniref:Uncharacterized protein n=2 Tax=Candidatus Buchananiibacteriota TaxID=1817903 RepID=A0A1G1XSS0_9BACT|nr:MAG: hypothetical protein A2731_03480 [Candidatus Buchananbacteria bacterium RIFCSPHIGHO2_01_FULL_39_8]OGY47041.1 MAG: hypothetical protein A3J62_03395 [Candidatus Buchananbacteria bacterium RIFCSPHIGHO2_02_FULL_38_8]